jgi:hypothetical protein
MPENNSRPTILQFAGGTQLEIPSADHTLRIDMWADIFDGKYRLLLTMPMLRELEQQCGYVDHRGEFHPQGTLAIYGQVSAGRYELEGKSVGFAVEGRTSVRVCQEVVRLALIGGGLAVVNGETVNVRPQRAKELVENYLVPAPAEASWDLAYLILHTRVVGRKPLPHEVGEPTGVAIVPPADDRAPNE